MDAAALVPVEPPGDADVHPADNDALALAQALEAAAAWQSQILALALSSLGEISLPEPQVPPRSAGLLSALPVLYWVHGLDQTGLLQAAETVAGLWASGTIQVPLPDRGQALQSYWRARRQRLSAEERAHLLGLVFDPRDFEPAMRRLCQAVVALADNAGQRDIREEVGLEHSASALMDLCATRLEGAPLFAAPDLLAQTQAAVALLSQKALQTAFAVRDFYALIELGEHAPGARPGRARNLAERAQAGAAVLRWLVQAAALRFAIDPRAVPLQALIADAQRWLMGDASTRGEPGHGRSGVGVAAA